LTDFITGLILGAMLVFFITEYRKWIAVLTKDRCVKEKSGENSQWQNLMNYDGSGRGQINRED